MKYLILILFVGCVTPKKVTRYLNEHPLKAAEYCSKAFPAKDSIAVKDSVSFDTLWIPCDTLVLERGVNPTGSPFVTNTMRLIDSVTKRGWPTHVPCISKTFYKDSIIYRRDFARETVLSGQNAELSNANIGLFNQNNVLKEDVKRLKHKAFNLWLLIIALVAFSFRRQIAGLVKSFL